jgi:hypothetical protein
MKVCDNVGLRRNGLPKALGPLLDLITSGDLDQIKFRLTLLSIGKPIEGDVKPNLNSITEPWSGHIPQELEEYIPTFVESIPFSLEDWESPHWSTKRGPSDQALKRSMMEFLSLPSDLREAIVLLGGPDFNSYFNKIKAALKGIKLKEGVSLRKLSFIKDKEMKTRTIAILDYWSQTVLKPIHDSVMKTLGKLPGDFTYQGNVVTHLQGVPGKYYSLDLKDATDRFPVKLQRMVLEHLIGKEKAIAWEHLLVRYPYDYKIPNGMTGKASYLSGQPMGAYSS